MITPTLANVGVPMLWVQFPLMMCALVPVILAETFWMRRRLGVSFGKALGGTALANCVSTIVGLPVAWAILVGGEMLASPVLSYFGEKMDANWQSPLWTALSLLVAFPWLGPGGERLHWMIPAASALLLIPSYFASIWIERSICRNWFSDLDRVAVGRTVTSANRLSYAVLFLLAIGWMCFAVARNRVLDSVDDRPVSTAMVTP